MELSSALFSFLLLLIAVPLLSGWLILYINFSPCNKSFGFLPVNEITQDCVARYSGIVETGKAAEEKGGTDIPCRRLMVGFGKNFGLDESNYLAWNNDIAVNPFTRNSDLSIAGIFLVFMLLLPAVITLAFNIYAAVTDRGVQSFSRKWLLFLTVIFAVVYLISLYLWYPHWRNYQTSYRETYQQLEKNTSLLENLLKSDRETGICRAEFLDGVKSNMPVLKFESLSNYPAQPQERNVHNGEVFLSKAPFFPYDYIRINVDLYNYLFWGPDLEATTMTKINPYMTYTKLSDGFWLGQYTDYINWEKRLYFCYYVALFSWLASLVLAVRIVRSGFRNANQPENPPTSQKKLFAYYAAGLALVILGYKFSGAIIIVLALIFWVLWVSYDLLGRRPKMVTAVPAKDGNAS